MTKEQAIGAYKALKNILKTWDRTEYDNTDFIEVPRLEKEMQRFYELSRLLEEEY